VYSKQPGKVHQLFIGGGGLRLIDSLNFLQALFVLLVKNIPREHLQYTSNLAQNKKQRNLPRQKGIYPYEFMDEWERFSEKNCHTKRCFTAC